MLPILKKKHSADITVATRKPDQPSENIQDSAKDQAAKDLIRAITSNDSRAVVMAMEAMLEILASAEPEEADVQA